MLKKPTIFTSLLLQCSFSVWKSMTLCVKGNFHAVLDKITSCQECHDNFPVVINGTITYVLEDFSFSSVCSIYFLWIWIVYNVTKCTEGHFFPTLDTLSCLKPLHEMAAAQEEELLSANRRVGWSVLSQYTVPHITLMLFITCEYVHMNVCYVSVCMWFAV